MPEAHEDTLRSYEMKTIGLCKNLNIIYHNFNLQPQKRVNNTNVLTYFIFFFYF